MCLGACSWATSSRSLRGDRGLEVVVEVEVVAVGEGEETMAVLAVL